MSKTKALHLPVHHPARCRCPDCPVNKVNKPVRDWMYQLDEEDRMEVAFTLFMKIDEEVRLSTSVSQAVSMSLSRIKEGYTDVKKQMDDLNLELKKKTEEIMKQYAAQLEEKTGKSKEETEKLLKKKVEELAGTITKLSETNQTESRKFLNELVDAKIEELKKRINDMIEQGKSIDQIKEALTKNTNEQIEAMKKELVTGFKDVLRELGFPEAKTVEALQGALPIIQARMDELLKRMTIPSVKGELGELELQDQLREIFPEDTIERIGGAGQPDIIARPKYNGLQLSDEILIESKTEERWSEAFTEELRRHMSARNTRYGILSAKKIPSGGRECMPRDYSEGLVLVASRSATLPVYAAIRTMLGMNETIKAQEKNLRRVLHDERLIQAIQEARGYEEIFSKLRTNAKNIVKGVDEAGELLKGKLDFLEQRIQSIVTEVLT